MFGYKIVKKSFLESIKLNINQLINENLDLRMKCEKIGKENEKLTHEIDELKRTENIKVDNYPEIDVDHPEDADHPETVQGAELLVDVSNKPLAVATETKRRKTSKRTGNETQRRKVVHKK